MPMKDYWLNGFWFSSTGSLPVSSFELATKLLLNCNGQEVKVVMATGKFSNNFKAETDAIKRKQELPYNAPTKYMEILCYYPIHYEH